MPARRILSRRVTTRMIVFFALSVLVLVLGAWLVDPTGSTAVRANVLFDENDQQETVKIVRAMQAEIGQLRNTVGNNTLELRNKVGLKGLEDRVAAVRSVVVATRAGLADRLILKRKLYADQRLTRPANPNGSYAEWVFKVSSINQSVLPDPTLRTVFDVQLDGSLYAQNGGVLDVDVMADFDEESGDLFVTLSSPEAEQLRRLIDGASDAGSRKILACVKIVVLRGAPGAANANQE